MRRGALVTGGAVRLGRALVLSLASRGRDIALHYSSSSSEAQETKKAVEALGVDCRLFRADLSGGAGVEEDLVSRVLADLPRVDLLVNSASAYESGTLLSSDQALFESQMRVNAQAPMMLARAFAQKRESGHIVNILDNKIAFAQYQYTAYLLSKKTLAEFTRMAALELAPRFRVNGIAPGVVLPATTRDEAYLEWRVEGIPLRRKGRVEEVALALGFLDENEFVTGQILFVDGGESVAHVGRNAPDFRKESR